MNPQPMTGRTMMTLATMIFAVLLCGMMTASAATLTVNSTGDAGDGVCDAAECTLREAIVAANASADDDVIGFDPAVFAGTQTITLTQGELTVAANGSLTINGPGASKLTVSGNNASRVFNIGNGATTTLDGLTVANGRLTAPDSVGAGIRNAGSLTINNSVVSGNFINADFSPRGGGIYSNGSLTLNDSAVAGNSVVATYPHAWTLGGGVYSDGTFTVTGSTFSGNSVSRSEDSALVWGGAISAGGTTVITNSTLSGNSSPDKGGAIYHSHGTLTLNNSTITGNSAFHAAGIYMGPSAVEGSVICRNSIIAGNTGGYRFAPEVSGIFGSQGNNLIGNTDGSFTFGGFGWVSSDKTGTSASPLDAKLGPLQDNGGLTQTHALLAGSPAINAGSNALAVDANNNPLTTDQRGAGYARVSGGTVDIGAFEFADFDLTPPVITPTVTGTSGSNGWYVSDVQVSWSVVDNESAVSDQTGCDHQSITSDTAGVTLTCSASSGGGTDSQSVTIKRDATAPQLAPTVTPNPVLLGGAAAASANATDDLSGVASQSCGSPDTSSVGAKSATCTATDSAGNTANAPADYQVVYNFAGFFQPVDNLPALNIVSGGQAVPLRFSLGGNQGLAIFAPGYPASGAVACDANEPGNVIEETVGAGGSSLSYNATTDQYSYVWKTEKAWKGTCRILVVKLKDGTEHYAKFRLK